MLCLAATVRDRCRHLPANVRDACSREYSGEYLSAPPRVLGNVFRERYVMGDASSRKCQGQAMGCYPQGSGHKGIRSDRERDG